MVFGRSANSSRRDAFERCEAFAGEGQDLAGGARVRLVAGREQHVSLGYGQP